MNDLPHAPLLSASPGTDVTLRQMAHAVRALAVDAIERANSGHPGMPLGMADVATVLWTRYLTFDPAAPGWPDRDRFVLSAGHGSMLLYALLHLIGVEAVSLEEIKRFRALGSKTPGHPEFGHTPGVETTTGPLGQGLANALGMALAEARLAAEFGRDLVDHWTYVIAGDGCLMEGISHEAASLAGHLRLGRLIVFFDDNGISIDGPVGLACSDDVLGRFAAYGWQTLRVDGHDLAAVAAAIEEARADPRPSLIACRTVIGFGAPRKAGTEAAHGAPLGAAEAEAAKRAWGWESPPFVVPESLRAAWREVGRRGAAAHAAWRERLAGAPAERRSRFLARLAMTPPSELAEAFAARKEAWLAAPPALATRKASEEVLAAIVPRWPALFGGSADLTHSNNTWVKEMKAIGPGEWEGNYLHYGVREHAMAAVMNGLALHGGFLPYGGTFLVFSDYLRPALRLSALMGQKVVYIFTHDSIGLGEDGPTHQPVEHLASLRAIPRLLVFRPADAVETLECWEAALAAEGRPSALVLTRQTLPPLPRPRQPANLSARGAYVAAEASGPRRLTLLASGSEVHLALAAREILEAEGLPTAVVSMPCFRLFDEQPPAYRAQVLGRAPRLAIEAASPFGWARYTGSEDHVIGLDTFGASGPGPELFRHFGLTPETIVARARLMVGAE